MLQVVSKRRREHPRENFQRHRQEKFHERDEQKRGERNEAEDVRGGPRHLPSLPPRQLLTSQRLEQEPGRDLDLDPQELRAHPVVRHFVFEVIPPMLDRVAPLGARHPRARDGVRSEGCGVHRGGLGGLVHASSLADLTFAVEPINLCFGSIQRVQIHLNGYLLGSLVAALARVLLPQGDAGLGKVAGLDV